MTSSTASSEKKKPVTINAGAFITARTDVGADTIRPNR